MSNAGAFIAAKQREMDAMYAEFERRMLKRLDWEREFVAEMQFVRDVRPWYRKALSEPARWWRILVRRFQVWKENRG